MKVGDVMKLVTSTPAVVDENATLPKVLKEMVKDPRTQVVYVVSSQKKIVGIITLSMALEYLYHEHIPPQYLDFRLEVLESEKVEARDIMLPPVYVKEKDPISDAFAKMFEYHLNELPVVNDEMHVVGDLHALELIKGEFSKN